MSHNFNFLMSYFDFVSHHFDFLCLKFTKGGFCNVFFFSLFLCGEHRWLWREQIVLSVTKRSIIHFKLSLFFIFLNGFICLYSSAWLTDAVYFNLAYEETALMSLYLPHVNCSRSIHPISSISPAGVGVWSLQGSGSVRFSQRRIGVFTWFRSKRELSA